LLIGYISGSSSDVDALDLTLILPPDDLDLSDDDEASNDDVTQTPRLMPECEFIGPPAEFAGSVVDVGDVILSAEESTEAERRMAQSYGR
jgi:hypothetical protein